MASKEATERKREALDGLDTYDGVGADIIRTPGKFEGCCTYVPYFYSIMMDGCGEDDGDGVLSFDVEPEDAELFPALAGCDTVKLYEDDQGFVNDVG